LEKINPPKPADLGTEIILAEPPPLNEEEPPPPPVEPPPPLQESVAFKPPVVVPHDVEEPPPPAEVLAESNPGTVTQEGNGAVDLPSEVTAIEEPVDDKPVLYAEQPAEFPGGEAAMYTFIKNKTKFPEQALDAGVEGTVYVNFVVDKEGKVVNIKVIRDAGYGTGDAVVEAIKKMPAWKPAKQNGRVVSLQFSIPVKFNFSTQ